MVLYFTPLVYLLYNIIVYFFSRVPIIYTPKNYYSELFKNIEIGEESVVYELGCGKANFLFLAEKRSPRKLVGFELSFFHVFFANIKSLILKSKVKVYLRNFFKADISDASIIYMFLVEKVVNKAWEKIEKEVAVGTIVVTLSDKITGKEYVKKIPTRPGDSNSTFFYLYKV